MFVIPSPVTVEVLNWVFCPCGIKRVIAGFTSVEVVVVDGHPAGKGAVKLSEKGGVGSFAPAFHFHVTAVLGTT